MINKQIVQFDFNDLIIEPEVITSIKSRKNINIRENNMLPLMTAPMDTVINEKNSDIYENLGIIPVLTRIKDADEYYASTEKFLSYSLSQVEDIFLKKQQIIYNKPYKVLIDVANGHMKSLHDLSKKLKKTYGDNIKLMVGNIANPVTIDEFCKIKVDYVRIGIGGGSSCFIENTEIKTLLGKKKISEININDEVLTHKGNYKKVYNLISYKETENLIKVNNTTSTKNHEYYVLNKKFVNLVNDENIHEYAEWIKAESLTKEYLILQNNQ
jgi:hypothetical protein